VKNAGTAVSVGGVVALGSTVAVGGSVGGASVAVGGAVVAVAGTAVGATVAVAAGVQAVKINTSPAIHLRMVTSSIPWGRTGWHRRSAPAGRPREIREVKSGGSEKTSVIIAERICAEKFARPRKQRLVFTNHRYRRSSM
jgi:hypothetical protein